LPDGDSETANRKTKDDRSDACAHPGEKRALIREMIAREVRIAHGRPLRILR